MKLNIDIKVYCTCGAKLRIVDEAGEVITVAPCQECRKDKKEEAA